MLFWRRHGHPWVWRDQAFLWVGYWGQGPNYRSQRRSILFKCCCSSPCCQQEDFLVREGGHLVRQVSQGYQDALAPKMRRHPRLCGRPHWRRLPPHCRWRRGSDCTIRGQGRRHLHRRDHQQISGGQRHRCVAIWGVARLDEFVLQLSSHRGKVRAIGSRVFFDPSHQRSSQWRLSRGCEFQVRNAYEFWSEQQWGKIKMSDHWKMVPVKYGNSCEWK